MMTRRRKCRVARMQFPDHAEAEKAKFPILVLPFLDKHLQTHIHFELCGCRRAGCRYDDIGLVT